MSRKILNSHSVNITRTIFLTLAVLCVFSAKASAAEKIKLTLEDAPLTILKDSSVTKKIIGIPSVAGSISLKIKWHVLSFIPNNFNKLKIELLHGSRVLVTKECYSVHSDKTPKCTITKTIDEAEANASGDYKLRATNENKDDINGFNILKEFTDINPAVAGIESTFERDCDIGFVSITGETSVSKRSTVEKKIVFSQPIKEGSAVQIKAKWHGYQYFLPGVTSFYPLKVEVLYNGSVVASDEGYSIHANEKGMTKKIDIKFNVAANQITGEWKMRIINDGAVDTTGFNIEKSFDSNPFVREFRSTFNPCK